MDAPLKIEVDREADGRWIAEAIDWPGVLAYGASKEEARRNAEVLARQIIAEREWETQR